MKKINSKDFIKIMREEYNRTLEKLSQIDDAKYNEQDKSDDSTVDMSDLTQLLSVGLNIKHVKTGINYEIIELGEKESALQSPDGKKYVVSNDALDRNFAIN